MKKFRVFISRKNEVICATKEIKDEIVKWTQNEEWDVEAFAYMLNQIGIATPVILSEYDEENHSFKCVNALNGGSYISLFYGDWLDNCSEICVTKGEEIRHYEIIPDCSNEERLPRAKLSRRIIKRNQKVLESHYCEYWCHRKLKLDDTHTLIIEIDEPDKYAEKSEILVLRNYTEIEEYLIGLENPVSVQEVYGKLIEFLGFSNEDISKSNGIKISYVETIEGEEHIRGIVYMIKGKMQEFAILEDGETYHVFENGNWSYISDYGISISCKKDKKQEKDCYVFSITDSEGIFDVNQKEIMEKVKPKISELWQFVLIAQTSYTNF